MPKGARQRSPASVVLGRHPYAERKRTAAYRDTLQLEGTRRIIDEAAIPRGHASLACFGFLPLPQDRWESKIQPAVQIPASQRSPLQYWLPKPGVRKRDIHLRCTVDSKNMAESVNEWNWPNFDHHSQRKYGAALAFDSSNLIEKFCTCWQRVAKMIHVLECVELDS